MRLHYIPLALLCLSAVVLIALQIQLWGWLLLLLGVVSLLFCKREFAKDMLLVYISLAILGITPITTDISYMHMLEMGTTLGFAVAIPYLVSKYFYKTNHVKFTWHHGRRWFRTEIFYIFLTAFIAYFFLPFYLRETSAYLNWSVEPGITNIGRLFIGTNALGIWDELFFICVVLGILRRYVPFFWANIIQAILFTSFLYELGFTGWGPIIVYLFAFLQGIVFRKTDSLFYVITIHLTLDFILFLALIHAHHPTWMPVFFT